MIGDISTDRLALRPVTLDDVALLLDLDSDEEVMRYLTGRPSTTGEVEATVRDRLGCRSITTEIASGSFVGWFGLVPGPAASYEVGYRLRREWWGYGLATEGTKALIDAAFRLLHARRVTAQTMAVNARSRIGDDAVRHAPSPDLPHRVGATTAWYRGGRGRVRAHPSRMGGTTG